MNPSLVMTPMQLVAAGLLNSGNKAVNHAAQLTADASLGDSYVQRTKATRVEPLALIDNTIQHLPIMTDVMHSLTTQLAALYIQTLSAMTRIGTVTVMQQLDRLNPDRNNNSVIQMVGTYVSNESLPVMRKTHKISSPKLEYSIEAASGTTTGPFWGAFDPKSKTTSNTTKDGKDGKASRGPDRSADISEVVKEIPNLLVGKIVDVTIQDGADKFVIPITFKIIPMSASPRVIGAILSMGSVNNTLYERWHSYRAGQLNFWSDFVFMNDLLKDHRKLLKEDTTGFYREALRRRRTNQSAAIASGKASAGTSSNIIVISKAVAAEIERKTAGNFNNPKSREQMIEHTSAMLLAIVDPDYETVKFYYKSIPLPTELTFRDLKSSNKKTGPDITEILAAFNQMQAPKF